MQSSKPACEVISHNAERGEGKALRHASRAVPSAGSSSASTKAWVPRCDPSAAGLQALLGEAGRGSPHAADGRFVALS